MLLLIWFPLILRLPHRFQASTTLSLNPYLWHWLGVTGALFVLSAAALALRLRTRRHGARKSRASGESAPGHSEEENPNHRERPGGLTSA
jgi:hypothetical protein